MTSKLMLMGAASALLVSFACGCAAEMGTDEGTSMDPKVGANDPKAGPADEKTGTTESPQIIYGNPAGYNPPGYNPYAPGLNPPGYNPPGMGGIGVVYPYGYRAGVGYPYGMGLGYPGNLNGGLNMPGPY